jgi:hypothetical protein
LRQDFEEPLTDLEDFYLNLPVIGDERWDVQPQIFVLDGEEGSLSNCSATGERWMSLTLFLSVNLR